MADNGSSFDRLRMSVGTDESNRQPEADMRRAASVVLLAVLLAPSSQQPLAGLDAYILKTMPDWHHQIGASGRHNLSW